MIFLANDLSMQAGVETRQISAENPTGKRNSGCRAVLDRDNPDQRYNRGARKLGFGWKVHPFTDLKSGITKTLADIKGPGCISQIFLTSDLRCYSELILKIYWDDEVIPSVETPIGAFFAMGHDFAPHEVYSAMVTVAPYRGMNCYWQMPFRKSARITISNDGPNDANIIAYRILYKLYEINPDAAYFHAQYRRSLTKAEHPEHVILDDVKGKGLYVGTYLAWNPFSTGWWGEGEVKMYIDGEEFPSIVDNGTEDYFGGAWCFHNYDDPVKPDKPKEIEFNSPFLGLPLARLNPDGLRKYSLYRWHILDSIGFKESFKCTVQSLGWYPDSSYRPSVDDITSVAYWYQSEPHVEFPILPNTEERWDK